jgi:hypothetical protein
LALAPADVILTAAAAAAAAAAAGGVGESSSCGSYVEFLPLCRSSLKHVALLLQQEKGALLQVCMYADV